MVLLEIRVWSFSDHHFIKEESNLESGFTYQRFRLAHRELQLYNTTWTLREEFHVAYRGDG